MDPQNSGFPPSGSQPPFGQGPSKPEGAGGFGPNAYQAPNNPYADPSNPYGGPPRQGSRWWLWLLAGGGGALLLVCCGCAGLMWFSFDMLNAGVEEQLNNDPVVQEHLGEVNDVNMNFIASGEETQKQGNRESIMVWDVEGTKGKGRVIGRMVPQPDGTQRVQDGKLRMSTGEEYPLSD